MCWCCNVNVVALVCVLYIVYKCYLLLFFILKYFFISASVIITRRISQGIELKTTACSTSARANPNKYLLGLVFRFVVGNIG